MLAVARSDYIARESECHVAEHNKDRCDTSKPLPRRLASVNSEGANGANISPGAVLKSFPIGISTGLCGRPSGLLGVRGEQAHRCRRHDL